MEDIITLIQERLSEVKDLKYIDEDWGQLDYYSSNPPVKWPCVLIDVAGANFSNIGNDRNQVPVQRQNGSLTISLKVANLKLSNTSLKAPKMQKEYSKRILTLLDDIHSVIHGWSPSSSIGKMIRVSFQRVRRDDGIQEYQVLYSVEAYDV